MTVKTKSSQKCPCVRIWVNSQNRLLTGFDLHINFQLMPQYRRVNQVYFLEKKSNSTGTCAQCLTLTLSMCFMSKMANTT